MLMRTLLSESNRIKSNYSERNYWKLSLHNFSKKKKKKFFARNQRQYFIELRRIVKQNESQSIRSSDYIKTLNFDSKQTDLQINQIESTEYHHP